MKRKYKKKARIYDKITFKEQEEIEPNYIFDNWDDPRDGSRTPIERNRLKYLQKNKINKYRQFQRKLPEYMLREEEINIIPQNNRNDNIGKYSKRIVEWVQKLKSKGYDMKNIYSQDSRRVFIEKNG